jgi:hypothetical protein
MNSNTPDSNDGLDALERHSRDLLRASAEALDGRVRSRLNQARQAAVAELGSGSRSFRVPGRWLPAGALAGAAALAVAVWIARPVAGTGVPLADAMAAEDVEMLASNDGPELYADDADFYEWAGGDTAAAAGGEG